MSTCCSRGWPQVRELAEVGHSQDVPTTSSGIQSERSQVVAEGRKKCLADGNGNFGKDINDWLWETPLPAPPAYSQQELYYLCTGHCGGLADRLIGMLNVYLLAVLTKRSFRVIWTDPGSNCTQNACIHLCMYCGTSCPG